MAGFFKRLVGRFRADEDLPSPELRTLFEMHAGLSRERQIAFEEFLRRGAGQGDWHVSLHAGTLSLNNERYIYPIQWLGTRSDINNSWLWAWADRGPDHPLAPQELLTCVKQLRGYGDREHVPELTIPGFELGGRDRQIWFDVQFLGLIACAIGDADFYVGVPYPGGEMVVVFNSPDITAQANSRRSTIRMTDFFLSLSILPIERFDQANILRSYARRKDYPIIVDDKRRLEWSTALGDKFLAEFDDSGRIKSCSVSA